MLAGMMVIPSLLRAVPSRYIARLPEPFQQLGAPRDQASILPTAEMIVEASNLLEATREKDEVSQLVVTSTAGDAGAANPAQKATTTLLPSAKPVFVATPEETATPMPTPSPSPIPIPVATRLEGITHQFQSWNNCGPATLAMTLSYFDLRLNQEKTAAVLKPNPEDRNVSPSEMVAYVENETEFRAIDRANGNLDTIRRLVSHGIPVILEIGIDPPGEFRWMGWYGHYLLIVAYDDEAQQFWVYDSWFGTSEEPLKNADAEGRDLPYSQVEAYWPHFNRNYIAIYSSDQADTVASIIGEEMDDAIMWQNALADVRAEAAANLENAFVWFNLGTIYNALGQYEEAALAYDQARSVGLPWRMLWYQFGPYEAYYHSGRYEDVILLADVTLKDRPYFEESYYFRGLAQAALGNSDAAHESFERAIDFNPNYAPAVTALEQIRNG